MSDSPAAKRARVSSQFRRAVREYIVCDNNLEQMTTQRKEVKKRRDELREQIQEYMVRNEIPKCRLLETGDRLAVKSTTKKQKATKKDISDAVAECVSQEQRDQVILRVEQQKSQMSPVVSFSLVRERDISCSHVSISAASDSESGV